MGHFRFLARRRAPAKEFVPEMIQTNRAFLLDHRGEGKPILEGIGFLFLLLLVFPAGPVIPSRKGGVRGG